MEYQALFVVLKQQQTLKMWSAAKRCVIKGLQCISMYVLQLNQFAGMLNYFLPMRHLLEAWLIQHPMIFTILSTENTCTW